MEQNQNQNRQSKKPQLNKYVQFSAWAFQMIAVFVLLSLGGNWLDKHFQLTFPALTLTGVFIALAVIFYNVYTFAKTAEKEEE